jgi:PAS domain S-box-containing protein
VVAAEAAAQRSSACWTYRAVQAVLGLALLAGLAALSYHNFLLFHSTAELFSVTVAAATFMLAWNARRLMDSRFLLFVAIGLLFVAGVDLLHTLAYSGMGVFAEGSGNLATQLWIAGRYLQSLTLLLAPVFLFRRLRPWAAVGAFAAVTALLLLSIFRWQVFPTCYVAGAGGAAGRLTAFKIISEYVACAVLALAMGMLVLFRKRLPASVWPLIAGFVGVTILSELAFTQYASVFGPANRVGHLLKVVAVYLFYRAVVVTACMRPFELLFHDLQRSRAAIRRSEERFDAAVSGAHDGIWDRDLRTDEAFFSSQWKRMLGYRDDELPNELASFERLVHPDDLGRLRAARQAHLRGETEVYTCEFRMRHRDGSWRWILSRGAALRDAEGVPYRLAGSHSDITERKRQERSLRESQARLRRLFNADLIGIVCADAERITDANDAFLNIVGYTRQDLAAGRINWRGITPPEYADADKQALAELLETGACTPFEKEYTRKDGRRVPILIGGALVRREPLEWICFVLDITERTRAERELRAVNADLERLVAERTAVAENRADQLQKLALELGLAEQRERSRLARLLHDHLQQALAAARFQLGLMEPRTEADAGEAVERVDTLLEKAIEATQNLTAELRPPLLHQKGLAAALEWLGENFLETHGLDVHVQADPAADPPAEGVGEFLYQAARELLFNAVKHAETDAVRVRLAGDGRELELVVEDDGVGFDPAERDQGDEAGGFGLFSIRERLDALGGRFEADSAPGRGARFALRLSVQPQTNAAAAKGRGQVAAPTPSQAAASLASAPPAGSPPEVSERAAIRILLADDHAVVREGLCGLLQRQDHMQVVGQAEDGREAIELARETRPDVILMDVSMPEMSGVEATEHLSQEMPDVRIIALSMHVRNAMEAAMLSAGAAAYVTKGGPSRTLLNAIREVVAGLPAAETEARAPSATDSQNN